MNPDGLHIPSTPDPSKTDPKELLDQIGRLNQQLIRERQESTRRLTEDRAKFKAEMDKLRSTTHQHGQDLQNQNAALLQSLGRMKAELDDLNRQLIMLQARTSNGDISRVQAQSSEPATTLPVMPQSPSLGGEQIPMPPRV